MSRHLTVTETIELLDSLKAVVREFAAAEEKLNKEHKARTEAAQKRFSEDLAAHDSQSAQQASAIEQDFASRHAAQIRRHDRRKARLSAALKSAQTGLHERIENEEGRARYQSQKGLLDTQRWRGDSLAQNDHALAEFQQRISDASAQQADLEHSAAKALRGYGGFRSGIFSNAGQPTHQPAADEFELLKQLQSLHSGAANDIAAFRKLLLPKVFAAMPLWLWVVIAALVAGIPALQRIGVRSISQTQGAIAGGAILVIAIGAYLAGRSQGSALAKKIGDQLHSARQLADVALEKAGARHASEIERIETESKNRTATYQDVWKQGADYAAKARESWPAMIEQKRLRAFATADRQHYARISDLEEAHRAAADSSQSGNAARRQQMIDSHEARVRKFTSDYEAHWQKLAGDWRSRTEPLLQAIREANTAAQDFAPWNSDAWAGWSPPAEFGDAVKFAALEVDLRKFAESLPRDPRLAIEPQISVPLLLKYPQQGSLLFETTRAGNEPVFAALNNIIFRLLASTPVGKLSLTLIDPVKLGQSFSTVMHLADYEDNVISGRIWTQAQQIEERLAELNEHMEKVIQMYLRNEYETIADYNRQAGNIAEKYHFVVVADFPANFSETAVRRLLRIAASGARCGVFTLIHWDHRHTAPPDFFPEELRKSSVCVSAAGEHYALTHPLISGARVLLDPPPPAEFATSFLQKAGEAGRGSNRVEVPFDQVAPAPDQIWSIETADELRVPIGRSGATKLQYLAIGKGTRQHVLIAGKTGSGKSTLFHVIITNLALWCSPEQVEFYLVDFKKGVEFKSYASHQLPHAKVVAIESDREFGLSVLQRLDDELKRRGELFRKLGVQDLPGYKRAGGSEPMPRALLLIDEFQEFFVEDDRISQAANLLLDRIVRQGRAFGIHVLLGSQTLGGAYTLARTTIGQMVVRIALQCNEADAYLIMDENNAAPRLLSRPGEGIYNDMAGASEANSPFQAVWIDDEDRDRWLARVRQRADAANGRYAGPIVFEGNAPAEVKDNHALRQALTSRPGQLPPVARIWLGAPNSIKGPTEAAFANRSGNNLLVVGQREEAMLSLICTGLISLAAQLPPGAPGARASRFIIFESAPPGSPERSYIDGVVRAIGDRVTLAKPGEVAEVLNQLSDELQRRVSSGEPAEPIFLFVHGAQNFKKLRQEDEFAFSSADDSGANPPAQFQKLITEGPAHGIHLIVTFDTYNNVNRFIGRKALSDFEMRVLFQMSANDSSSLCDDPKASMLGLHRALLYNEQEGYLETFRPYALPDPAWVDEAGAQLRA